MSDFLTHLAARALAQPTLHPRTRMRFEPETGEEPAATWPERAPSTPIAEREPEHIAAIETARVDSEPSAPQPPRVITRDVVRTEQRVRIEPRVETRVEREVLHRVEPRVRMRDRVVREREVVRNEIETTKIVPHRFDEEAPVIREAAPVHAPREPKRGGVPKPATLQERTPSLVTANPQPAPDVHVSIGRVEIRAITPPASSRKTAARSGTMTLDDYVAKRNRERR